MRVVGEMYRRELEGEEAFDEHPRHYPEKYYPQKLNFCGVH